MEKSFLYLGQRCQIRQLHQIARISRPIELLTVEELMFALFKDTLIEIIGHFPLRGLWNALLQHYILDVLFTLFNGVIELPVLLIHVSVELLYFFNAKGRIAFLVGDQQFQSIRSDEELSATLLFSGLAWNEYFTVDDAT